jgi:hypothetical protein
LYSPHTALDAVDGGTNDVLADALGMTERASLRPIGPGPADTALKLVTFVPAEHVDSVSRALFGAGAGRIGKYTSCSFRAPGTGTFFGEEGANPVVGVAGKLEEAAELRLETLVPLDRAGSVVEALRSAHPYEEPAFDLVRLTAPPPVGGFGRIGSLDTAPVRELADRVKRALGTSHALVVGSLDRLVSRAAVCAGSGGEFDADAAAAGAQLLLTGELRHHDALRARSSGLAVVSVLHSTSERAVLVVLEERLAEWLLGVTIARSRADREPFAFA